MNLDHVSLTFYRVAFTELQLFLFFGFHCSPPQETPVESITQSAKSIPLRLLSTHLSLTLKAEVPWKKFLLNLSAEQSFTLQTEWIKKKQTQNPMHN